MSQINATTRSTKRNSARAVSSVDAGFLSSAKTSAAFRSNQHGMQPGSPQAVRVFVCPADAFGRSRALRARSLARRLTGVGSLQGRTDALVAPAADRGTDRGSFRTGL